MRTGFVTDPIFGRHDTGPGHPERPERIPAVLGAIRGLDLVEIEPRDATRDELEVAHDPAYVQAVEEAILS